MRNHARLALATSVAAAALCACDGSDVRPDATDTRDARPDGVPAVRDGSNVDAPDLDATPDADAPDGAPPPDLDATPDAPLPACPAGSAALYARTECPGAPPAPPPALASTAGGATRGAIVDLGGFNPADAPCVPSVVCAPDDAPTLLFSDEPESPADDGVLYADFLDAGRYRVYVYHANGGATLRRFPVVVLNQGTADAHVTITRRGVVGPGTDYVALGRDAAAAWLRPLAAPLAVVVPAGRRVVLDADLDARRAARDELVHAIYDLAVDARVKLSVVSLAGTADAATATAALSVLPSTGVHVRGTFARAERELVAAAPLGSDGVRQLRLGANALDLDLAGTSFVDGGAAVSLHGNFGVRYRIRAARGTARVALLVAPRGGAWGGAASLPAGDDGAAGVVALPGGGASSVPAGVAAVSLGRYAAGAIAPLELISAGGSSMPVAFTVVPLP